MLAGLALGKWLGWFGIMWLTTVEFGSVRWRLGWLVLAGFVTCWVWLAWMLMNLRV
jgi:hypothetical protein